MLCPLVSYPSDMVERALVLMALSAIALCVRENNCLVLNTSPPSEIGTCLCPPGNEKLLDLGRGHYPRFLISLVCEPNRCSKPPYVCSSLPYKVRVLKWKGEEDDSRPDATLPKSLQDDWKFVNIPIVIACVCSV